MRDVVETPEQAAAERLPPLLVLESVEAVLDAAGLGAGPLRVERIGAGHSNITFLIRRGGDRFVLRRPPRPPLPPSAHDVLREARLLEALAGKGVRIPRVLHEHADEATLGVPFYVMEVVDGVVLDQELPPALDSPVEHARIGLELVDALAELHAVPPPEGRGGPTGYLERQLRRFSGLWELTRTRELPAVEEAHRLLAESMPDSPPATVVHGDYRLGNTMYAAEAPARLLAILDWELATVGDPLADVGYLSATWTEPGVPSPLGVSTVTARPGFSTKAELVARYEEVSGRRVERLAWYQALALWKASIFLEGNYKRFLAGTTDDPYYATLDTGVPALAAAALELARAEG